MLRACSLLGSALLCCSCQERSSTKHSWAAAFAGVLPLHDFRQKFSLYSLLPLRGLCCFSIPKKST